MSHAENTIAFSLAVLLFVSVYSVPNLANATNGPRADLDIFWYASGDAAFTALQSDQVDFIQWGLSKAQKEAVEADPNLQIARFSETGMFEFDLNNNATIKDYPNKLNPMSVKEVRQAFSFLIDKDYVIANILESFGSRIDAPVAYPETVGWVNESVVSFDWNGNGVIDPSEDNYPYKYNPNTAATLLADLGFSDTDANGYLNYPTDPMWMDAAGIDTTAMPLKFVIRDDSPHRTAVGRYAYGKLEGNPTIAGDSVLALSPAWAAAGKVGGDFDTTDETLLKFPIWIGPVVFGDRNYHIYTGGWSLGRFPTSLFNLYHSTFWFPYGSNYVTNNMHPILDSWLEGLWYAPDVSSAQASSKLATGYHVSNAVTVPLWSYANYYAWRKEIAGVVNMKGVGPINDYTFLNAYRATNPSAALRLGVVSSWGTLNVLYSQWYFENVLLDRVYAGGISANPYDLSADVPWAFQDWEVGTWLDGTTHKTKVTYWLRRDVGGAQPSTGYFTGFLDAWDLEFSIWFNYAYDDSWQWGNFMDIHHTEIVDGNAVTVYFDNESTWFAYAPTYPLLGPRLPLVDQLCEEANATFSAPAVGGEIQFGGTQAIDGAVMVVSATSSVDGSLVEGVDYHIRAGRDVLSHNVFVNDGGVTPGSTLTIVYYKGAANGASGTYLGGNLGYDWTDTMFAYGMYYPISITSTSAALNRNPFFFLNTPLLGEVDWRWNWIGSAKPRNGYFKIDILDVVKLTGAYSSRGDGLYNPVYFPGADVDFTDLGHIGILDMVTVTGKYAQTSGTPPASVVGTVGGSTSQSGEENIFSDNNIMYLDNTEYPSGYMTWSAAWFDSSSGTVTFSSLAGAASAWIAYSTGCNATINTFTGTVTVTLTSGTTGYVVIAYTSSLQGQSVFGVTGFASVKIS